MPPPSVVTRLDCRASHNNEAHGTAPLFEAAAPPHPELVVRRGKPFVLRLLARVGKGRSLARDATRLVFAFTQACPANAPVPNAIVIYVPVYDASLHPRADGAVKVDRDGDVIDFHVMLSVNAPVGLYNISVHYETSGKLVWQYTGYEILHLLFNSACKDDAAYLPNETARCGYLTPEKGVIFTGSEPGDNSAAMWHFGQFELISTRVAHDLLAGVDASIRSDPALTARALCLAVNSRLSYGDSSWSGSTSILESFRTFGRSSGVQCYMFAGVLASLLRSVGLCARCVTNYQSAIDHNGNLTIEKYILDDGSEKEVHGEKVWNFHAWTEVWCRRSDLHPDMAGWQAVDATYGSGPAPVRAIKLGLIHVPFDVAKFYMETNADMVKHYGRIDFRGEFVETRRVKEKNVTGLALVTTSADNPYAPLDVTMNYKHVRA